MCSGKTEVATVWLYDITAQESTSEGNGSKFLTNPVGNDLSISSLIDV